MQHTEVYHYSFFVLRLPKRPIIHTVWMCDRFARNGVKGFGVPRAHSSSRAVDRQSLKMELLLSLMLFLMVRTFKRRLAAVDPLQQYPFFFFLLLLSNVVFQFFETKKAFLFLCEVGCFAATQQLYLLKENDQRQKTPRSPKKGAKEEKRRSLQKEDQRFR